MTATVDPLLQIGKILAGRTGIPPSAPPSTVRRVDPRLVWSHLRHLPPRSHDRHRRPTPADRKEPRWAHGHPPLRAAVNCTPGRPALSLVAPASSPPALT